MIEKFNNSNFSKDEKTIQESIDDNDLDGQFKDRLVQTKYAHGVLPEHIPLAVKILDTPYDHSHRVIVG